MPILREAITLEELLDVLGEILDEYNNSESNVDDRAALRVAYQLMWQFVNGGNKYLYQKWEQPSTCPRCDYDETVEWELVKDEKVEVIFYRCEDCELGWYEIYIDEKFHIWTPEDRANF